MVKQHEVLMAVQVDNGLPTLVRITVVVARVVGIVMLMLAILHTAARVAAATLIMVMATQEAPELQIPEVGALVQMQAREVPQQAALAGLEL
jgi:hypothetical protein